MSYGVSIPKLNDDIPNEDSFRKSDSMIAVSDGAGGCGLFARQWSKYLIRHIPKKRVITCFTEFDKWIDGIWEAFFNEYEAVAKEGDGIYLNKFYNEGSCATVAAAWRVSDCECRWMAYGDSVVFHYNRKSGLLEHSFTRLADFSRPPMLVSCKDPLVEEGFRCGAFHLEEDSVVFAASDALSHYVLMMYELANSGKFGEELAEESLMRSGNSVLLRAAEAIRFDFQTDVLVPLMKAAGKESTFRAHVKALTERGVLDVDDMTVVFLGES